MEGCSLPFNARTFYPDAASHRFSADAAHVQPQAVAHHGGSQITRQAHKALEEHRNLVGGDRLCSWLGLASLLLVTAEIAALGLVEPDLSRG